MNNNDDRWRISEQDAGQSHNYMQSTTQEEWSKTYQQNALKPAYLSTQSLATMAPMQMSAMPFMTTTTSSAMNYSTTPTLATSTVPTLWSTNNLDNTNMVPSFAQSQMTVPSIGTSTVNPMESSTVLKFSNSNDKIQHAMNVIGAYVGTTPPIKEVPGALNITEVYRRNIAFPGITPLPTFSGSTREGMTSRTTPSASYVYSEERSSEHPVGYDENEGEQVPATMAPTRRPTMTPTFRPVTTRRATITTSPTLTHTTPTPVGTQGTQGTFGPTPTASTVTTPPSGGTRITFGPTPTASTITTPPSGGTRITFGPTPTASTITTPPSGGTRITFGPTPTPTASTMTIIPSKPSGTRPQGGRS